MDRSFFSIEIRCYFLSFTFYISPLSRLLEHKMQSKLSNFARQQESHHDPEREREREMKILCFKKLNMSSVSMNILYWYPDPNLRLQVLNLIFYFLWKKEKKEILVILSSSNIPLHRLQTRTNISRWYKVRWKVEPVMRSGISLSNI